MTDAALRALLVDSFTRIREQVSDLTDGLDESSATFRPDAEANSIAWLLWHLTRIEDDHVAHLAGEGQIWPTWRERFGLPFSEEDTGYGHSANDVAQVRVSADLLDGYQADVHQAVLRYLETVDSEEVDRVVDTRWDPPVTAGVRLVSVLGDAYQHLGQAAYVRGMAERAGAAQ
jgi:hypothetical protein